MKENKISTLDKVLNELKTFIPQKKSKSHPIKLKKDNRKVTITLGKWAKPYLKAIKNLSF